MNVLMTSLLNYVLRLRADNLSADGKDYPCVETLDAAGR